MESRQCKRCNSENLSYTKHIYKDKVTDKLFFHIREYCKDCGFSHLVRRDAYTYEKTKDQEWVKSPAVKKLESQSKLFGEDL